MESPSSNTKRAGRNVPSRDNASISWCDVVLLLLFFTCSWQKRIRVPMNHAMHGSVVSPSVCLTLEDPATWCTPAYSYVFSGY